MTSMRKLREIDCNTRVMYHLNYWDGPISGICLWNGDHQYFECENIDDFPRIYVVYDTPRNIIIEINKRHDLFQKYVGTHTDYDINGLRHYNLRPSHLHSQFYDKKFPNIEIDNWNILGRFTFPF